MTIFELLKHMLPQGTDAFTSIRLVDGGAPWVDQVGCACPTWPPDLFAVVGRLIEESGCYTLASPNRGFTIATRGEIDDVRVKDHRNYLEALTAVVGAWSDDPLVPPEAVSDLWDELVGIHGQKAVAGIESDPAAAACVLRLFAIADEACRGMGWGDNEKAPLSTSFAHIGLDAHGWMGTNRAAFAIIAMQ